MQNFSIPILLGKVNTKKNMNKQELGPLAEDSAYSECVPTVALF